MMRERAKGGFYKNGGYIVFIYLFIIKRGAGAVICDLPPGRDLIGARKIYSFNSCNSPTLILLRP